MPLIHLINSKTDRFKYKAVLRESDAEALPVPVLEINRMSVKAIRQKKHLTWNKVCWEIYGQNEKNSWAG